jgi:hypothetical protein
VIAPQAFAAPEPQLPTGFPLESALAAKVSPRGEPSEQPKNRFPGSLMRCKKAGAFARVENLEALQ